MLGESFLSRYPVISRFGAIAVHNSYGPTKRCPSEFSIVVLRFVRGGYGILGVEGSNLAMLEQ